MLALACAWGGATAEAEAARDEAAALIGAMSDDELAGSIDAAAHLAAAELYLDRYEEAVAHAERALAVGRATGQLFPTLVPTLATAHFMRGGLADAAEAVEGGVESARLAGNRRTSPGGSTCAPRRPSRPGTSTLALQQRRGGRRADPRSRGELRHGIPGSGAGRGAAPGWGPRRRGRDPRRLGGGRGAAADPGRLAGDGSGAAHALPPRARPARGGCAGGGPPRRRPRPRPADGRRAGRSEPRPRWRSTRASRRAAAERALASAAAAERAGAVVEAALSRTLAGRALARAGDADAAVAELERAAAELEACGAMRYRDAAERELRKLGHHIHRRTRPGSADGSGARDR